MIDPGGGIRRGSRRIDHVGDRLLGASGDHDRHAHHRNEKTDDPHTRQSGPV
jgi:hypothetical protein